MAAGRRVGSRGGSLDFCNVPSGKLRLAKQSRRAWVGGGDGLADGGGGDGLADGGGVFALIAYRFQFAFSGPPLPSPLQQRQPQPGAVP